MTRRRTGRPRGSRDRRGRARRASFEDGRRWQKRIGAVVRHAREDADISVAELAAALDCSRHTLFLLEAGRHGFTLPRLWQVAQAIGVPIDHFITEDP